MNPELVLLVQEASEQGSPPIVLLIGVGLVIMALTTGVLMILTRTMPSLKGIPARILILAAAYNALIVGVKFVLAPLGIYETNRETSFESLLGFGGMVMAGAGAAFVMYFLVLWVIYWAQRRSVRKSLAGDRAKRKFGLGKWAVIGIFAGVIVLSGGGVLFLAYLVAADTLQYLSFVFSSVFGGLIFLMLFGATILAGLTFKSAAERSVAVGNAALLASVFWVAVCLLATYHVLWVVFILLLNSVWPLRVVVPK